MVAGALFFSGEIPLQKAVKIKRGLKLFSVLAVPAAVESAHVAAACGIMYVFYPRPAYLGSMVLAFVLSLVLAALKAIELTEADRSAQFAFCRFRWERAVYQSPASRLIRRAILATRQ